MKTHCIHNRGWNPGSLAPLSDTQSVPSRAWPSQRVGARRSNKARAILVLASLLAVLVGVSPESRAAVSVIAGNGTDTVAPGGTLTLSITVSAFTDLQGLSFTLNWNSSKLSYVTNSLANTDLRLNGVSQFGNKPSLTGNGQMTWAWVSSVGPFSLSDGSTTFTVTFTADSIQGPTSVFFNGSVTPLQYLDAGGNKLTPGTVADTVIVAVPEPVNCALGLFACLFVGGSSVRWISRRKAASQSGQ